MMVSQSDVVVASDVVDDRLRRKLVVILVDKMTHGDSELLEKYD